MTLSKTIFYTLLAVAYTTGPIMGLSLDSENEVGDGGLEPRQFGLGVPAEKFIDSVLTLFRAQVDLLGLNSVRLPQIFIPETLSAILAEFSVKDLEIHGMANIHRFGPINSNIGIFSSSLESGLELQNVGTNFMIGSGNISYNCPSLTIESKFTFKPAIPLPKISLDKFTINSQSCNGSTSGGEDLFLSPENIVGIINASQNSTINYLNGKMTEIFEDILGRASQIVFG